MADFVYLEGNALFFETYKLCQQAENAKNNEDRAIFCRDSLLELFRVIYSSRNIEYPESPSLVELIDGPVITAFVADKSMLAALHFIRKIGNNVQHGIQLKKKEGELSYSNLKEFVLFTFNRIQNPGKPFKSFSFEQFTEAK